jgi:uncharacterized membrane protein (DUF2068 family)
MNGRKSRQGGKTRHNKGLLLIASYSLLKATLFLAVGVGAIRLLHKDLADEILEWVHELRVDPTTHLVNTLLEQASIFNDNKLRELSLFVFGYAGLNLLEGVGLYLEQVWAEYLTLIITGSFLPLELYELIQKQTLFRAGLLIVNLLVLIYLAIIVFGRRKAQ